MKPEWKKEAAEGTTHEVRISMDFNFPRKLIFEMLTDPKKAVKVWGPEGSVKHLFELDPRPGGAITIHDGDAEKVHARTSGTIIEFVVPERFVFQSATTPADGGAPWEALQTVTFEELGPKRTRLTVLVKIVANGSFPGGVESLEEGYMGGWTDSLSMLRRAINGW